MLLWRRGSQARPFVRHESVSLRRPFVPEDRAGGGANIRPGISPEIGEGCGCCGSARFISSHAVVSPPLFGSFAAPWCELS